MGSAEAIGAYMIMQQSEWAGRSFITARDRRTGEVDYLITEPAGASNQQYSHDHLPPLRCIHTDGAVRTMQGPIPEGRTLEDLRHRGELEEGDLHAALLAVLDGLACLAGSEPPIVPAYLDPACIKRDRLGRWMLDYLALAHAPEVRGAATSPPGVYAFGALLFWLVTGQTVRVGRADLGRIGRGLPSSLQFLLLQSLTRSYPSLVELRKDVERAARDRAFRPLLQRSTGQRAQWSGLVLPELPVIPTALVPPPASDKPSPELQYYRVQLGGPYIPADDRPWALPERPQEGFRKFVVPPPDPGTVKRARLALAASAGALMLLTAAGLAVNAGLVPDDALPPSFRREQAVAAVPAPPGAGQAVVTDLPPDPQPPEPRPHHSVSEPPPDEQPADPRLHMGKEDPFAEPSPTPDDTAPEPEPARTNAASPPQSPQQIKPAPGPMQPPKPDAKSTPAPSEQAQPAPPARVDPVPGSSDDQDWKQGGVPVLVWIDGRMSGWAYLIPHPTSPWISLPTLNRLFQRSVFWLPQQSGMVRLISSERSAVTTEFELVQSRLWIKLSPTLQEALGVSVTAYDRSGIYFAVQQP